MAANQKSYPASGKVFTLPISRGRILINIIKRIKPSNPYVVRLFTRRGLTKNNLGISQGFLENISGNYRLGNRVWEVLGIPRTWETLGK